MKKISKSKNLRNFDLLWALEIRGYEKLRFLLRESMSFEPFCVKIGWGFDPQSREGKKSESLGLPQE